MLNPDDDGAKPRPMGEESYWLGLIACELIRMSINLGRLPIALAPAEFLNMKGKVGRSGLRRAAR